MTVFSFKKTCFHSSLVRWAEKRCWHLAEKRLWYLAGIWLSFGVILCVCNETFPAYLMFPPFFQDKNGSKNLGKFVSSPTKEKGHIQLSYSDGDSCDNDKKITTNITLVCKPGTVTGEA